MWAVVVAAVLTVGLSVSGCGSPGACPMYEVQSRSVVNAHAYMAAHPGLVAEMGACLGAPAVCGATQAEAHLVPVTVADGSIDVGDLPTGRPWVRVVLVDASGRIVLDVTGKFTVTHSEVAGCPNTSFTGGTAVVTAEGTLS
ncbi:hypothetical protein GXW82_11455 [Streptacidiphilus sp. 4-A2]|nr:hypothetical protein [Streptacidiphilus sp. 4-A2]